MTAALEGRVALVTGGSRGIGAAVARAFAAAGARVAIAHEPTEEMRALAQHLADELNVGATAAAETGAVASAINGPRAVALGADLADPAAIEDLVAATRARLGPLDIVVANAAAIPRAPWHAIPIEQWDRVQQVNVRGTWLLVRAAYPDLQASDHASVITVTSVMVETGQPGALHYTASKAAIIGMTRALARDLGEDGIRVNAVMPGAIRTEHEVELAADAEAAFARITAKQALKRRGFAEDMAGTFLFLASDDSSFTTGQVLTVDGGWVMR